MPRAKNTTDNTDVAALRAELEAARTELGTVKGQRDQYATDAREAKLARMSAEERALVSDLDATDSTISSLNNEIETAEAEIARLSDEGGQGAAVAKLTRAMAKAEARLLAEEQKKEFLTGKQEQMKARPSVRDEPAGGDDRVLANGAKLGQFGPATQAWLVKHPQAFTDRKFMTKAIAAAMDAEAEGIADQSPEYFAHVEEKLGLRAVEQEDGEEDEQGEDDDAGEDIASESAKERYEPERPQARAAGAGSMAAAPTRQVPQGGGNGGNRRAPALTAQEKEVADGLYGAKFRNPADRYKHYAEMRSVMNQRDSGHFNRN